MLKLEIYTPSAPKESEPVRLALHRDTDDVVKLYAVDQHGRRVACGTLLAFLSDGSILLYCGVDPKLGFKLDPQGRISVVVE